MHEKTFDKIQHAFMIKVLKNVWLEGTYLSTIKRYIWETQSLHYSKWRKEWSNPTEVRNATESFTIPTLFQHCAQSTSWSNKASKENERDINRKWRSKINSFSVDIRDPKNSNRKFLEMIKKFNNMSGYRTKLHKSIAFLYIKNIQRKNTLQLIIASK